MYVINEHSKTPIFQINQHIGDDKDVIEDGVVVQVGEGQGIDGKQFAIEVLSLNDRDLEKLIFYTNSQGGDVQQSLDMFNAISMSKNKTHAIITGFAFSCAGWIPLAADKVDMVRETGRWMCHMPYNPENPDEKSDFMDNVVDIISRTIASKSGRNGKTKKTQADILSLMKEKTWWDAEKMHEEGLIDNIVEANGKVIRMKEDPITLNKTELNFYYREYQFAQNKLVAENRDFSEEERKKLSKEGKALPDGSFPIESEQDLKNAIHAIGRAKNPSEAKAHIKKRAKELGLTSLLPDNWDNAKNQIYMPFPKAINRLNAFDKAKTGLSFNLTDDSSEEVLVDALARVENRLRAMNDEMMDKEKIVLDSKRLSEDLKNKMDEKNREAEELRKKAEDATKEHADMKVAYDKMCGENSAMKTEKETAENKAKEAALSLRKEKATNFVEKLIAENRVHATSEMTIDEVKNHLINRATENYEDVVTQFSFVPIRVSAPKMKNSGDVRLEKGSELEMKDLKTLIAANTLKVKANQKRTENGVTRQLWNITTATN